MSELGEKQLNVDAPASRVAKLRHSAVHARASNAGTQFTVFAHRCRRRHSSRNVVCALVTVARARNSESRNVVKHPCARTRESLTLRTYDHAQNIHANARSALIYIPLGFGWAPN